MPNLILIYSKVTHSVPSPFSMNHKMVTVPKSKIVQIVIDLYTQIMKIYTVPYSKVMKVDAIPDTKIVKMIPDSIPLVPKIYVVTPKINLGIAQGVLKHIHAYYF